ncbi:phosphohistidine phosphatase SixA [Candidatus Geothermarchaeota archaeon]|nr:MAG: phosphohistidine phosphatase SixA [Candidatus Geothermarchaeota archaeon]HEW93934.1 phosphohistidine phosphatase SixA [Thermoprotei archaeon]
MRRLYIMQHGKAYPKEVDPDRKLTEEGIRETQAIARFLASKHVKISKIFHSGKTRARMTAEIIGEILNVKDIYEAEGLSPLDDPNIWARKVGEFDEDIMLVGHLPHLSKLVTVLLNVDREAVKIRYSGILCLLDEDGRWIIEWYVTPDLI